MMQRFNPGCGRQSLLVYSFQCPQGHADNKYCMRPYTLALWRTCPLSGSSLVIYQKIVGLNHTSQSPNNSAGKYDQHHLSKNYGTSQQLINQS